MRFVHGSGVHVTPACLSPEIARMERVVLEEASRFSAQIASWVLTSCYREGDDGLHGRGLARDYDAVWSPGVDEREQSAVLRAIAHRAQTRLGADYDVLAHGRRMHVHAEFDPKLGKPIGAGFYDRVAATRVPRG